MKVILKQELPSLGEEGDIKMVADGYARNFLIPKGLAVPCTKQNLTILEQQRLAIGKKKDKRRSEYATLREKIEEQDLEIAMTTGEKGRLFGSVTSTTLSEALREKDIMIDRRKIQIPGHSIKVMGKHTVEIKLYEGQVALLRVNVIPSNEEENAD